MADFDPTAKFRASFFQECDELLRDVERMIQGIRDRDVEAVNSLFRAVHTVKGGAGMFQLNRLVSFAHLFENQLENVRSGKLSIDDAVVADFLRACDVLVDLVQDARGTIILPGDYEEKIGVQLSQMGGVADKSSSRVLDNDIVDGKFVVRFKPDQALFRRGNEPLLILRELSDLGYAETHCNVSALPAFDQIDVTSCYLSWVVVIETTEAISRLRKVFEFVATDETVDIAAERRQAERRSPPQVSADQVAGPRAMSSVRVELDRIDRLVNHVGEIAIVQAMIDQQSGQDLHLTHPRLTQAIEQLSQLIQGLQDNVMAIRAVPVDTVFSRMSRLVRELATATGKRVNLKISGEETEIDKTVVEQLGDPLLHMIRNAVDHGIESPEDRIKSGKNPEGRIDLSARQRGGQIIIEVADDGRGLDRDRIRARAVERGIISETANLVDDEITNLIFQPGFSTAEKVSDISGRGVGMDVVKRNIQKLGGRVTVRSEFGQGSRMTIALPLTLAILSGMIVRSGNGHFVVPISNIIECMQTRPGQIQHLPEFGELFRYRDQYLPLMRLNKLLGHEELEQSGKTLIIVVDDEDGNTLGLAVHEIIGQQQVVIKNMRDNMDHIPGVSGATILGDGAVALILILSDLLELHRAHMTSVAKARAVNHQPVKAIA